MQGYKSVNDTRSVQKLLQVKILTIRRNKGYIYHNGHYKEMQLHVGH